MKNKIIFIIDDDLGILDVTKIILDDAGYEVYIASNEQDMLKLLETHTPAVILLDILLSGTDGREICQRLKADKKTTSIPVVIMSADTNIEEKYKIAKADDYIRKPFEIEDLEKKVEKWVTSS